MIPSPTKHDKRPTDDDASLLDLSTMVPEPTANYLERARARLPRPDLPRVPVPRPPRLRFDARFLIWKQDPTVGDPGIRTVYLQGLVLNGPKDARITTEMAGTTPVARNANADFIFAPGTPEFDCAHTFAVVRQTLTMMERMRDGAPIPWAWNSGSDTSPLTVHPDAGVTANAYYSRGQRALKFFHFTPGGATDAVHTCRSLDIAAHEAGHAILDGLKPGWLAAGNPPQTGGLHESFGDLAALFLALSHLDQVEAFVALSKADLHTKNFLAALAEEFGAALGMPLGLRNADNDLKLSQVSNQVHAISQVFTGGIYDTLADIFAFEWNRQRAVKDPAHILLEVARDLCQLVLSGILAAPSSGATFADVVSAMLTISHGRGDPPIYRTFLKNRFALREVVVPTTPLTALQEGRVDLADPSYSEDDDALEIEANPIPATLHAPQDRDGCCGTMLLPEFTQVEQEVVESGKPMSDEDLLASEIEALRRAWS